MKCPICNTEHNAEPLVEECPVCDWIITYTEDDSEYDEVNHTTMASAKENFKNGLNIWGKPLKTNN